MANEKPPATPSNAAPAPGPASDTSKASLVDPRAGQPGPVLGDAQNAPHQPINQQQLPGAGDLTPHNPAAAQQPRRSRTQTDIDAEQEALKRPNLTEQQLEGSLMGQYLAQGKSPQEAKKLARERAAEMCKPEEIPSVQPKR
jgi:hypothetical protein